MGLDGFGLFVRMTFRIPDRCVTVKSIEELIVVVAGILRSIQVGQPKHHVLDGVKGSWFTGYIKEPVTDLVWMGVTNIDGDGQGNRKLHGGPDMAVLVYSADHYDAWRVDLPDLVLPFGAFAENLTVAGLDEGLVCIGDRFAVGEAVVEVTQPRNPCLNIDRRWPGTKLMKRVEETGRSGWYVRVVQEGSIEAGLEMLLVERPYPEWTVRRAQGASRGRATNPTEALALAALPPLSQGWKQVLSKV